MTASDPPRRIAIFGGCFNPVHNGHLYAARRARDCLRLDDLRFVPTREPPMRRVPELIAGRHRLAMLEHAIANEPGMSVSPIEIEREGPSFTVDTVHELQALEQGAADWYFVLGADCLPRLPGWKGFDRLRRKVRFAILPRGGRPVAAPAAAAAPDADAPQMVVIPMADCNLSSTMVRDAVGQGRPVTDLVPPGVEAYIEANQLYRTGGQGK